MSDLNNDLVKNSISSLEEPKLNVKLLSSNLIRNIKINNKKVSCDLVLIAPDHPDQELMISQIKDAIMALPGVEEISITPIIEVPFDSKLKNESQNVFRS